MRVVSHFTWEVQAAQVVDVVLGGVPLGDLGVLLGQLGLGPVELGDGHAQPHVQPSPASLVTRTAATLWSGCLETGSHSVTVSSLAA
jgi:hypothetical protein